MRIILIIVMMGLTPMAYSASVSKVRTKPVKIKAVEPKPWKFAIPKRSIDHRIKLYKEQRNAKD